MKSGALIGRSGGVSFSFEFFPPRSESASRQLMETIGALSPLRPSYVSVTYGAGGSTRDLTHDLVVKITGMTGVPVVPHLTCAGSGRREIIDIVTRYCSRGIMNIMALRGDSPPAGDSRECHPGAFMFSSELVEFIRKNFPDMGIGVAGYPEGHPDTPNRVREMEYLKRKVDCGADFICTQFFFDNEDFFDFRERCRLAGITAPVIAGIMPVTSFGGMRRMAELAGRVRYPAKLLRALDRAGSDEVVEKIGIHWAIGQVMGLLDSGVDGIHFYTLNRSRATVEIFDSLGLACGREPRR